ncbi:MAG TPA: sigma-54 dependent transcriptional regulator [Desulfobacteria bacterium]|nr:sigma-54 dependent transcriptional regulator [Desulfobacteria bacterium]
MAKILVIDDEKNMRWALERALKAEKYELYQAEDGRSGLETALTLKPDAVILDLKMPGMDGLSVLSELKAKEPDIMVIMITAHGSTASAVEAMKRGAYDYINKPFDIDELKLVVAKALEVGQLRSKVQTLESEISERYSFHNIVGKSQAMQHIFDLVERVSDTTATVLIQGESGTGKELVARALHYAGERKHGPFIQVNCAALPENLLESELFGHERGAFTGAIAQRQGRFELAHGGTIFLDEIGEINPHIQVKLLRVLQERAFERVGGQHTLRVDVRVIAATNRDLTQEMREGRFREDLFYRLNVIPIRMPSLRERKEDIPLLVDHFLHKYDQKGRITGISPAALKALVNYAWPGNIRELENTIERMAIVSPGPVIEHADIPPELMERAVSGKKMIVTLPDEGINLEELEQNLLAQALELAQGNKTKAARLLGLTRHTLLYRLEKYGLR